MPANVEIKARLAEVQRQLPSDVRLSIARDQSRYIYNALHEINVHLVLGSILACLVVLLFMRNWRSTVIAASPVIPTKTRSAKCPPPVMMLDRPDRSALFAATQ